MPCEASIWLDQKEFSSAIAALSKCEEIQRGPQEELAKTLDNSALVYIHCSRCHQAGKYLMESAKHLSKTETVGRFFQEQQLVLQGNKKLKYAKNDDLENSLVDPLSMTLNQDNIIKLQAVLRGFMDRLETRRPKRSVDSQWTASRVSLLELTTLPDYSNDATRHTLAQLKPFQYDDFNSDATPRTRRNLTQLSNGAVYLGEWNQQNQRHGVGTQYWIDGAVYEGYWSHDHINGRGRLVYADGDVYEGEWLDDKAHGYGEYKHYDGGVYKGFWKHDNQHGHGTEQWPDGARYEGDYIDGAKHGRGCFKWVDGSEYEGEFVKNNIEGVGTYIWSDGRKFIGEWHNNQMHGKGTFAWPDGRRYIGDYFQDKKEGDGVFVWPDGRKYEGGWVGGKQHGEGVYVNARNMRRRGLWECGKRTKWL